MEVETADEAHEIAARMVEAARRGPTTVSVGLAVAVPGETAAELVARADAAMYAAKRGGRDTVGG